ncbi:MAG: SpoIIE family protein phosphatase, partial [Bdellovibrionaceae bacterium]|nr:SpoIIE family protein phosphatase [Pseudobdellovibrionaceae bacterium]
MSIRLKIVASLIAVSLLLIVSYVFTAQRVFENDKISYIFEDQHNKVQNMISSFHQKIDDALWFSRFFAIYNKQKVQQFEDLKALFNDQIVLTDIFLYNTETKSIETVISKSNTPTPPTLSKVDTTTTTLTHLQNNSFLLTFPDTVDKQIIFLLIINYAFDQTPEDPYQYSLLNQKSILATTGQKFVSTSDLNTYFSNTETALSATTSIDNITDKDYLVSTIPSRYANIRFASMIPKEQAFGALSELYNKTIVYILISVLVIFIVSYLLSHRITYRMQQLTKTAEQIGAGHFDVSPPFESKDEVGTLANAFRKMGQEIKILFQQKLEKDRMERELQTASLIQKQLFPEEQNVSYNDHFLSGYYITSTECGGDWWYHFQLGFDVYIVIADATGHGIPAALITSASNAIFSHIREYDYSLEDMVRIWDETVFQSSKGQIFMTGQICRYNLVTGDGEIVNLGHEMPVIYSKEKKSSTPVILDKNFCLGERSKKAPTLNKFHLDKGETFLMYTDGILEITADGTVMSERRFFKKVVTFLSELSGPFDSAQG